MLVYSTMYKVMKKNMVQILIALSITIFFSLVMTSSSGIKSQVSFTETSLDIAIINNDSDTVLVSGLINFLTESNNRIDIEDNDEMIQDSLYFRRIDYVLIIPDNYTANFISGQDVELEKRTVESSFAAVDVDMSINKFLNLYKLYRNTTDLTDSEIVTKVREDLSNIVEATVTTNPVQKKDGSEAKFYFNYLNYTVLSGFTVCVASILLIFNKFDLKRRNTCSPMSLTKLNSQLFLGILTFGLGIMAIMLLISFILFPATMTSSLGIMFSINLIVLMIVGMSFSLLLSQLANKSDILDSISTVVSLGTSFLCGVFIPIEFISESVVKVSKFLPAYWYVSANERISSLTEITTISLTSIFKDMLTQLAFAFALFALALLISKQKRQSES